MNDNIGYSDSHTDPSKPEQYDAGFWQSGTTKNLLWSLEQRILATEFEPINKEDVAVLDFACGTGRVLSLLDKNFEDVTGLDISEPMARIARERCPDAKVIVGDILNENEILARKFDLISSFRFFLNAEPSLRKNVLDRLFQHLKPGGRLVVNFHLNPSSLTGLYLRVRSSFRPSSAIMMSVLDARELLESAGLEILKVQGYGYLPKHRTRTYLPRAAMWIESRLLDMGLSAEAAHSFVVTARRPLE